MAKKYFKINDTIVPLPDIRNIVSEAVDTLLDTGIEEKVIEAIGNNIDSVVDEKVEASIGASIDSIVDEKVSSAITILSGSIDSTIQGINEEIEQITSTITDAIQNNSAITAIQESIEVINNSIGSINDFFGEEVLEISTLEDINDEFTSIKDELDLINNTVAGLDVDAKVEAAIDGLDIETSISTAVGELETSITTITDNISLTIQELTTTISELEESTNQAIADLDESINTKLTEISHDNLLDRNNPGAHDVSAISGAIAATSSDIQELASSFQVGKDFKIYGTNSAGSRSKLLSISDRIYQGQSIDQAEVGSKSIHLNLATNNDPEYAEHITYSTPSGTKLVPNAHDFAPENTFYIDSSYDGSIVKNGSLLAPYTTWAECAEAIDAQYYPLNPHNYVVVISPGTDLSNEDLIFDTSHDFVIMANGAAPDSPIVTVGGLIIEKNTRNGVFQGIRFTDTVTLNSTYTHTPTGQGPIGTPQIGTPQIGTAQIGTAQIGTPQIGTPQIGTAQIGTAPVGEEDQEGYIPASFDYVPASDDYEPASFDYAPASPDYEPASPDYEPASVDYRPASADYVPASFDYAPAEDDYNPGDTEEVEEPPTELGFVFDMCEFNGTFTGTSDLEIYNTLSFEQCCFRADIQSLGVFLGDFGFYNCWSYVKTDETEINAQGYEIEDMPVFTNNSDDASFIFSVCIDVCAIRNKGSVIILDSNIVPSISSNKDFAFISAHSKGHVQLLDGCARNYLGKNLYGIKLDGGPYDGPYNEDHPDTDPENHFKFTVGKFEFNRTTSVIDKATSIFETSGIGSIQVRENDSRPGYTARIYSTDTYGLRTSPNTTKDQFNGISDALMKANTVDPADKFFTNNITLGPDGSLVSGGVKIAANLHLQGSVIQLIGKDGEVASSVDITGLLGGIASIDVGPDESPGGDGEDSIIFELINGTKTYLSLSKLSQFKDGKTVKINNDGSLEVIVDAVTSALEIGDDGLTLGAGTSTQFGGVKSSEEDLKGAISEYGAITINGLDTALNDKIPRDGTKVLSDNNYSTANKSKLEALSTINSVTNNNGLNLASGVLSYTINPDDKVVDKSTIPFSEASAYSIAHPNDLVLVDQSNVPAEVIAQQKIVITGDQAKALIEDNRTGSSIALGALNYFKRAGWVLLTGTTVLNSCTAATNIATLPTGFRPPLTVFFTANCVDGGATSSHANIYGTINTGGQVVIDPMGSGNITGATRLNINVTFPVA